MAASTRKEDSDETARRQAPWLADVTNAFLKTCSGCHLTYFGTQSLRLKHPAVEASDPDEVVGMVAWKPCSLGRPFQDAALSMLKVTWMPVDIEPCRWNAGLSMVCVCVCTHSSVVHLRGFVVCKVLVTHGAMIINKHIKPTVFLTQ